MDSWFLMVHRLSICFHIDKLTVLIPKSFLQNSKHIRKSEQVGNVDTGHPPSEEKWVNIFSVLQHEACRKDMIYQIFSGTQKAFRVCPGQCLGSYVALSM